MLRRVAPSTLFPTRSARCRYVLRAASLPLPPPPPPVSIFDTLYGGNFGIIVRRMGNERRIMNPARRTTVNVFVAQLRMLGELSAFFMPAFVNWNHNARIFTVDKCFCTLRFTIQVFKRIK